MGLFAVATPGGKLKVALFRQQALQWCRHVDSSVTGSLNSCKFLTHQKTFIFKTYFRISWIDIRSLNINLNKEIYFWIPLLLFISRQKLLISFQLSHGHIQLCASGSSCFVLQGRACSHRWLLCYNARLYINTEYFCIKLIIKLQKSRLSEFKPESF